VTRIGVIGSGWGSRVQAPIFREAGFDVVQIRGREWERFRDANVDVVSIVVPPAKHLEIARAALEAGKHVICEKPTALNAAEAEQLVKVAAAHPDRIAIVDHELRFLPSFRSATQRGLLAGGAAGAPLRDLGGIRYIEIRYSSPSRGDRSREWTWWSDASQGGGIWGAVGSHFIDTIRYLAGEIDSVRGSLETIIKERSGRAVTSDDFANVELRLKNGTIAVVTLSAVASGPDEPSMITLHGETGALRLTGEELLFAKPKEPFLRIAGDDLAKRPGNSPGGAFGTGTYYLALALKAALEEGKRDALAPAATFVDGLANQRVLDAARASSTDQGGWTEVER
jgi:predicted dehydrogenase